MNEPKPIEKLKTDLPFKNVVAYPIWKGDTTKIYSEKGSLAFADILYGTLFRFNG